MSPLSKDGIQAAAIREQSFHPKASTGADITAWERRATSLLAAVDEVNRLTKELAELKKELASRPF